MRIFIVIVIDQLSWEDRAALPALDAHLGPPERRRTSYLPTVTETAHATISLGTLPREHGVIGAETFLRSGSGLQHVRVGEDIFMPMGFGVGEPVLQRLNEAGVQCFVIAGKSKVAQLLDPRPMKSGPGPSTRFTYQYDRDLRSYTLEVIADHGRDFDVPSTIPRRLTTLADEQADAALFDLGYFTLSALIDPEESGNQRPVFLFLGLPSIDVLGHRYPRTHPDFTNAMTRLNGLLGEFVERQMNRINNRIEDLRIVVTSDHGYRPVDRTAVLSVDGRCLEVWAEGPRLESRIPLPVDKILPDPMSAPDYRPAVLFDGGTARFWIETGAAESVVQALHGHGTYIRDACSLVSLDALFSSAASSSAHPNWGDVIALSTPNVALCKREWVFKTDSPLPTLVAGEHGTGDATDMEIPCWGESCIHEDMLTAAEGFLLAAE